MKRHTSSEEAEAQIKRTLDLDSEFVPALETLGWLHVRAGRLEEGLSVFETLPRGRSSTLAALGFTLALLGRLDEATEQLDQLEASSGQRLADQVNIARIYAGLGEFDQTVRHLERAIEARVIPAILWDRSVRDWGAFREDSRFQLLVDRVEHASGWRS